MTDHAPSLTAALPCEDPEEPCDADGRDEHRWCDNCIARSVIARAGLAARLAPDKAGEGLDRERLAQAVSVCREAVMFVSRGNAHETLRTDEMAAMIANECGGIPTTAPATKPSGERDGLDPMWDNPTQPRTKAGKRLIASFPANAADASRPEFIRHVAQSIRAIEVEAAALDIGEPARRAEP